MRNDFRTWAWIVGATVVGGIVAALLPGMNPGVGIAIGAGVGVAIATTGEGPKRPSPGQQEDKDG